MNAWTTLYVRTPATSDARRPAVQAERTVGRTTAPASPAGAGRRSLARRVGGFLLDGFTASGAALAGFPLPVPGAMSVPRQRPATAPQPAPSPRPAGMAPGWVAVAARR